MTYQVVTRFNGQDVAVSKVYATLREAEKKIVELRKARQSYQGYGIKKTR